MPARIQFDHSRLEFFCKRWRVKELSLFGSVLREDFRDGSDVDVLIEWLPEAHVSLFDMTEMADELSDILGRRVDLVPKAGLKPRIRDQVLDSAEVVYAAA